MKLTKIQFSLLFELQEKQPWLKDKAEGVLELIEMCADLEEQHLVCALLDRFAYLTHETFSEYLVQMAKQITHVWGLERDLTQIVAMTHDSSADSAQAILQFLKPILAADGWTGVPLVNRCDRASKHIRKRPFVVLIDEFAGTGKTVCGRLKTIQKCYQDAQVQSREIRVCLLVCMEEAKSRIEQAGALVHASLVQKKGISGHYIGADLVKAQNGMLRLESLLKALLHNVPLPSFGYGQAEALYGAAMCNVPNSVFPLFWWPCWQDDSQRKVLLSRG